MGRVLLDNRWTLIRSAILIPFKQLSFRTVLLPSLFRAIAALMAILRLPSVPNGTCHFAFKTLLLAFSLIDWQFSHNRQRRVACNRSGLSAGSLSSCGAAQPLGSRTSAGPAFCGASRSRPSGVERRAFSFHSRLPFSWPRPWWSFALPFLPLSSAFEVTPLHSASTAAAIL